MYYMKLLKYTFVNNYERVWECYAESEKQAWEYFSSIKQMNANELKKIFNIT